MTGFLDVGQQLDAGNKTKGTKFIGKVVVNDDPEKLHRIKCEVPQLWDKYKQEELPWISPVGLIPGIGTEVYQWIPETGTYVNIELQSGDSHNPVYTGGAVTSKKRGTELDTNYPHRIGWYANSFKEQHSGDQRERKNTGKTAVNPAGHHFYLDRSDNNVEYRHPTGTTIHIDPNGRVWIEGVEDIRAHAKQDIILKADRDIRMTAGNEIKGDAGSHIGFNAPRIDLN